MKKTIEAKEDFKAKVNELYKKAEAVSKAVEDLKKTGLNERVLHFAIMKASQKYYKAYPPLGMVEVKAICEGLLGIKEYLFPKKQITHP